MRAWMPALILAIITTLAIDATAQPRPPAPPPGSPDAHLVDLARRAGLDAETLARLRAVADPARAERDRLRTAIDDARLALFALLDGDDPDVDTVMTALADVSDAELALDQHDLRLLLEMRAMLTPDQRDALDAAGPPTPPPPHRGSGGPR